MKQDDPVMAALSKLPLPAVDEKLTRKIQREAHLQLARGGARPGPWLDFTLAAVACTVAALHAGWAVTFVAGLYR